MLPGVRIVTPVTSISLGAAGPIRIREITHSGGTVLDGITYPGPAGGTSNWA